MFLSTTPISRIKSTTLLVGFLSRNYTCDSTLTWESQTTQSEPTKSFSRHKTWTLILPGITCFNKSLSSSTFPSSYKLAVSRSLYKVSPPRNPPDYRPICILLALSKCLQMIVHQHISWDKKVLFDLIFSLDFVLITVQSLRSCNSLMGSVQQWTEGLFNSLW